MVMKKKIWTCKVGEVCDSKVPYGADYSMRTAVKNAYFEVTGENPKFVFSGWGGELNDIERVVASIDMEVSYSGEKSSSKNELLKMLKDRSFEQKFSVLSSGKTSDFFCRL